MKNIAIIGTNGLPPKYGGFETFVNQLTLLLNNQYNFTVYCSKSSKNREIKTINNSRMIYVPLKANGIQNTLYDLVSIFHALTYADILIVMGAPASFVFPFIRAFGKKIIFTFGGLEWKRSKWSKPIRKYLKLLERWGIKWANVVISDNRYFYDYVKSEYGIESKIIEYGGDQVKIARINDALVNKYAFLNTEYCVSVARAQKDNMIHLILESFEKQININLVIVANWKSSSYGRELYRRYAEKANIYLVNATYDRKEIDVIRSNAKIYIHSHSCCGTAPSLVEAMFLGLPIISFQSEANVCTTQGKAFYFKSSEELLKIIEKVTNTDLERNRREMMNIAEKNYKWERIIGEYIKVFNNI